jgi:hypothetical protein
MKERSEATPHYEPQARIFSMGAFVVRHLPEVDFGFDDEHQSGKSKRMADDRLIRINNRYAQLGLALTPDDMPTELPLVMSDRELEELHENNNDFGSSGSFFVTNSNIELL